MAQKKTETVDHTPDTSQPNNNQPVRTGGSITLGDVAKLAGVAPTTVSRALNHPDQVAPKTLKKIEQAISVTGYVPNLIAGALASRRSHLIAAITPSISNTVYAETIKHLTATLRKSGYQVLLGETDYCEDQEESLVRTILSRKPDGIFFIGLNHSKTCLQLLLAANIPVVETWDLTQTPLDLVVGFSHERIGQSVAEYLLEKNYQKFALIWATDRRAQRRQEAFLDTLRKNGLDDILTFNVPVPSKFKQGKEGLAHLLKHGFTEGVVVCSSDTIAQGVLSEAHSRGISIPGQIGLMGFGDQSYAAHTAPSLTTVKFDRELIGQRAAEVLLARISGSTVASNVIDVGFEIIERETT